MINKPACLEMPVCVFPGRATGLLEGLMSPAIGHEGHRLLLCRRLAVVPHHINVGAFSNSCLQLSVLSYIFSLSVGT